MDSITACDPLANSALPKAAQQAVDSGRSVEALALYERAVRDGLVDATTRANYGVLLWRHYRFAHAVELFSQVVNDPSAAAELLQRIAHCYFGIGRFGQAATVMRASVARSAEPDAATLNTLAWTLERDHQMGEAREYAEAALRVDPSYGPAVRLLAHLDRRAGEMDRAAARLEEQLHRYPGEFDWGLRYELAAVRDRLGQYEQAWAALTLAKAQLASGAADHLRDSHFIRRRQWELVQSVTPADWRRWRAAGSSLGPLRRIAYLTGFPRSGTTLLEQIIASHGDAIDTDESGILASQFIEPIVWKAGDTLDALLELRSFDSAQLAAGRETFYELTESYLDKPIGTRLLIEKNPLLTADLPLPLRLFPEAKVLVALRDPRDVVLSYLFTMVPLNWGSAPALDVGESCRFYSDTMRHWLWWRSRLNGSACELRYEQMIADPSGETRRVSDFLGLEYDLAMLDPRRRAERKAVRTPTYDDVTKPLYTRAIGRWAHYEEYLEPGLSLLQPFVRAFGYAK